MAALLSLIRLDIGTLDAAYNADQKKMNYKWRRKDESNGNCQSDPWIRSWENA